MAWSSVSRTYQLKSYFFFSSPIDPITPPTTSLDGLNILNLLPMGTCSCVSMHGVSRLQFRGPFSLFLYMVLKSVLTDLTHLDLQLLTFLFLDMAAFIKSHIEYETLQAFASISVSKLCNFSLPCLVNFVKN